jgi:hypothetical protein
MMQGALIAILVATTVGCLVTACSENSGDETPGGGVCNQLACFGRAVEIGQDSGPFDIHDATADAG